MSKVKTICQKCGRDLVHEPEAYSCSYNCTFCGLCAKEMNYKCPNCMDKLIKIERTKGKRQN